MFEEDLSLQMPEVFDDVEEVAVVPARFSLPKKRIFSMLFDWGKLHEVLNNKEDSCSIVAAHLFVVGG